MILQKNRIMKEKTFNIVRRGRWLERGRAAAFFLAFSCFLASPATAQTATGQYMPGVTPEGAVYFLPKTALRITVRIEKTTYTPGDFAPYAERFLRLNNVSMDPSVSYRILNIDQMAVGVRDTTKAYNVRFNNKTAAINVALADDGVLLGVNVEPNGLQLPAPFKAAPKPAAVNPRQLMNEEILAAGSKAKMAQLTAQEIYDIRDSRSQLIKGQADFMPKDGDQMKLMLGQLDQQDKTLTSLFAGTVVCDTTEKTFLVCPQEPVERQTLFRFSKHFGLVEADDVSGAPYYFSIEPLTQLPPTDMEQAAKKKKAENGLYYNVPGKMRFVIYSGNDVVERKEYPAAQFGNVELLSGDLFNKHYGTKLWLNPVTGGIDKLEAEQPK